MSEVGSGYLSGDDLCDACISLSRHQIVSNSVIRVDEGSVATACFAVPCSGCIEVSSDV